MKIRTIDNYDWLSFDEAPPPAEVPRDYSIVAMLKTDSGRAYVAADDGSASAHEMTHWRAIKHPEGK